MSRSLRWRVTSDPKLQGMLCLRVVAYWFCCMFVTLAAVGFGASLRQVVQVSDPWLGGVVPYLLPCVAATLFVLPVLILDTLVVSNRFAGPMRRLTRRLKNVADGERPSRLRFRQGDYHQELASAWNAVADQLDAQRNRAASTPRSPRVAVADDLAPHAKQTSEAEVAGAL